MSGADKQAAREAITAYVERYGPDVAITALRGYVRATTGIEFAGPTLAALLRPMGYRREGYRSIEGCPGQALFYVLCAA